MQLRDLRAFCLARKITIVREYVDAGQSGTKSSRPKLDELMNDARKRKLDAVLCWRFDRFARSTRHLLLALEEFRSLGVQFISYQENIDTGTPLGQAIFTIISAVAQLERDLICERVSAGIRNARAKGKRLGHTSRTSDGKTITTQTSYLNGRVTVQNVTVRDSQGRVETTNVLGGKILP